MDIKEIALRLRNENPQGIQTYDDYLVWFAEALVAEIQRQSEPVASQFQDRNGNWCFFIDANHEHNTRDSMAWPIRDLFTFPPDKAQIEQRVAEWQPIETAPKDGTGFLAAEAKKRPFVALWLDADHPDVDEAGWYDHWNFDPVSPTHWMPLPKAPANTASS